MGLSIDQLPPEIRAQIPANLNGSIVDIQPAPGGGFYALGKDGGIFSLGGAQFHGAAAGQDYFKGREGSRLEIDPRTGGYTIVAGSGERYAYDAPYKTQADANSLYSDPAFLSFLRGSDLTLETAAQDVARKQRAYNDALALSQGTIEDSGMQERRGIDNSFEARGVYRAGQRAVQSAESDTRQANAISAAQADTASKIGDLQGGLAEKVAEQQRLAGEKGFNTAQTQELDQRNEDLRKKYPAQFAGSA